MAYGELVFAAGRYSYESARPIISGKLSDYYNGQLAYVSRFFKQHEFMCQYYKLGQAELDQMYYLRASAPLLQGLVLPNLEPAFSSAGNYLFSRFLAMENCRRWCCWR